MRPKSFIPIFRVPPARSIPPSFLTFAATTNGEKDRPFGSASQSGGRPNFREGRVTPNVGQILTDPSATHGRSGLRLPLAAGVLAIGAALGAVSVALDWSLPARATVVVIMCLLLWLGELAPVWVPTVILWMLTPVLLASFGEQFAVMRVLAWSADPVLALFFGGFALAAAASRQGADRAVAAIAIRLSRGDIRRLISLVAIATAGLSMWMSNIAAAALMLSALQPMLQTEGLDPRHRRALLLSVALAADVGGIATPIGSGPNGIAMAAVAPLHAISFLEWMVFGVPLTLGLLTAALLLITWRLRLAGHVALAERPDAAAPYGRLRTLGIVLIIVVALWLTEPLHGVRAWIIALVAAAALMTARLIRWRDVLRMDWPTLVLIAGGIALGTLLEQSGIVTIATEQMPFEDLGPVLGLLVLCLISAFLSALMSNTAAATFLIPVALSILPVPSTGIIIAVASSLGIPFVISTPPNAMAAGRGLPSGDLLVPGLILMVGGCIIIALSGPWVLSAVGIR